LAVISVAFSLTIPSVGASFVGRKKFFNSAALAFGALPGSERFTAQFLVATRLVTVRTGAVPAGNSATIIPIASGLFSTVLTVPPSHLGVLASVFWYGVVPIRAAGSQMWVIPEGFSTSTRAVTSKVRQLASSAASRSGFPIAKIAGAELAANRKSRRFIGALLNEFSL
jgi:hypothetical protein